MSSRLQALNEDSSWLWQVGDDSLVIDPWLSGSQKNGPSWFSEEWLNDYGGGIDSVPEGAYIFVAFPFGDHCHKPSLDALRAKGYSPVFGFKHKKELNLGPFTLRAYGKHPLQKAWQIEHKDQGLHILYSPHGFKWNGKAPLPKPEPKAWITSVRAYHLPWWLGGTVALAIQHQTKLLDSIKPNILIRTHDRDKEGKGWLRKWTQREEPVGLAVWKSVIAGQHISID